MSCVKLREVKMAKECAEAGCVLKARALNLCSNHYQKFNRNLKNPKNPKPLKEIKICTAQDCDRPVICKGYCRQHYTTFVTAPKARLAKPAKTKNVCDVSDCNLPALCKGYCGKHYVRFKKHGNTGVNYNRKIVDESGIKRKSQYMKKSSEKTLLRSQEETEVLTDFFSNLGCVDIIDRDICEKY